jgi:hypothetical protein
MELQAIAKPLLRQHQSIQHSFPFYKTRFAAVNYCQNQSVEWRLSNFISSDELKGRSIDKTIYN